MHKGTQGGLKLNFFLSPDTLGDWAHKNWLSWGMNIGFLVP